jgi:hypothetical protein
MTTGTREHRKALKSEENESLFEYWSSHPEEWSALSPLGGQILTAEMYGAAVDEAVGLLR